MMERVYDVLVKGGRLIDPAQGIDGMRDVAIAGGKVAAVAPSLSPAQAKQVVEASGKMVSPGWIDFHTHAYWGVSHYGIDPDAHFLNRGVTTAMDLGSSGAQTWPAFRKFIIERSRTRLYAYLNVCAGGMLSRAVGDNEELRFLAPEMAVECVNANRDLLLGMKVRVTRNIVGRNGLRPLHLARQAADELKLPLIVHPNDPDGTLADILGQLGPGDVMTHCFHGMPQNMLDSQGKVRPEVQDAAQRGVLFDVGHGTGSFAFPVAERALDQGIVPHSISSDLHTYSLYGPAYDQATTLSKFLCLGMPLPEVIRRTTANPARTIGQAERLGTLAPGAEGDVTIFDLVDAPVRLTDCMGNTREGRQYLAPHTVIKGGQVYGVGEVPPLCG